MNNTRTWTRYILWYIRIWTEPHEQEGQENGQEGQEHDQAGKDRRIFTRVV